MNTSERFFDILQREWIIPITQQQESGTWIAAAYRYGSLFPEPTEEDYVDPQFIAFMTGPHYNTFAVVSASGYTEAFAVANVKRYIREKAENDYEMFARYQFYGGTSVAGSYAGIWRR